MVIKFTVFWKVIPCGFVTITAVSEEAAAWKSLSVTGFQDGDIHVLNFTTSLPKIP